MHSDLSFLGFSSFFLDQLSRWPVPPLVPARIIGADRDRFDLWSAAGRGPARLAGALRRQLEEEALPGVGDWVVADAPPQPGDQAMEDSPALPSHRSAGDPAWSDVVLVRGVLERNSVFTRGAAGREARTQVVAANVDRVFIVLGLDAGPNPRAIDRYLARIWAGGAEPRVVLNKADLADRAAVAAVVADVEGRCPGVSVHAASALRAQGLAELRAAAPEGCTVALVGPSGAGKSTLVNALLGEDQQRTAAVRDDDARGRHTTTRRELLLLPGGGLLLDTPGMRELAVTDEDGLDDVFDDIARLAAGCRFRDCHHLTEPGCAVIDAVADGRLDPERLDSFRTLQREAKAYELRHDARARRQAARLWGKLRDEGAKARRWKGE